MSLVEMFVKSYNNDVKLMKWVLNDHECLIKKRTELGENVFTFSDGSTIMFGHSGGYDTFTTSYRIS